MRRSTPASCFLGQLDGAELITVEDLAEGGTLHPVQQAMVDHHGSQCGFCTPGIVMSLFALYHRGAPATVASAVRPTRRQSLPLHRLSPDPRRRRLRPATARRPTVSRRRPGERAAALAALADDSDLFVGDEERFFAAPASVDSLATLYARHPDATLVGGATDVGLWVTKQLRDLKRSSGSAGSRGLDKIEDSPRELDISARPYRSRTPRRCLPRSIPISAK